MLGIGLLGACAARTRGAPPVRDTIWYVSARARTDDGRDRRALADTLEYGAAIFERAPVRDPFADGLSLTLRDSLRLTRDAFLATLQARVSAQRAPDDFAVLYVHGFGTGLDECWSQPAHARTRSLSTAPWIAFCWPSHGAGITWPRLGSVFVRAYEDDTTSLRASAPTFRQVLAALTTTLGAPHLLVASHSLGGRLVGDVLAGDARAGTAHAGAPADTLRALAFLALDQDAATFADTLLPALRPRARRVVLYSSRRDRALTISRRMHDTPRAGLAEPAPLVRDARDRGAVTAACPHDNWFQRLFGNRHSVRRASALLWDLTHIVGRGFEPACRDTVALGTRDANGAWRLFAAARPDTARLADCFPLGAASNAARSRSTP
jgi:hypothetical protein